VSEQKHSIEKRQLTLIDCLGIGINGIVGSGIFLLPAALWRRAGSQATWAWLLAGGLCCLVALVFAEAAGRTDRSGGPYRYACDAFGPYVGFAVGWVTLVSVLLGYSAVARGFGGTAVQILADLGGIQLGKTGVVGLSCLVVFVLTVINLLGVRSSVRTSDAISAVKLLSLFGFIAVGFFFVKANRLVGVPASPGPGEGTGILAAAFAGLFATTGFEFIPVPAGEAKNPRRTVPLAMVVSVLLTTVIYVLVQWVATGLHPSLGSSPSPLADAVGQFAGAKGRHLMNIAGLISMFGFCAGSALVGPRYLESFAEDRFVPRIFSIRPKTLGTPVWSVVFLSALVMVFLLLGLEFEQLADISNVAVVIQYIATCFSVMILRRRGPAPKEAFVNPFGILVPLLSLLGCAVFLYGVTNSADGLKALEWAGVLIVVGLLLGSMFRKMMARPVAKEA
jgi:amino acid transporter